jgi:hypothetical protein
MRSRTCATEWWRGGSAWPRGGISAAVGWSLRVGPTPVFKTGQMSELVDRALRLWTELVPEGDDALEAFGGVYTDPLDVNGESTPLQVLVDRARMLQRAFDGIQVQIKERVEAPGRRAFAFQITARHVGPLETPLGQIAATGRRLRLDGMDIFVVDDAAERVTGVFAIADFLDLLLQAGALARATTSTT